MTRLVTAVPADHHLYFAEKVAQAGPVGYSVVDVGSEHEALQEAGDSQVAGTIVIEVAHANAAPDCCVDADTILVLEAVPHAAAADKSGYEASRAIESPAGCAVAGGFGPGGYHC